jgi:hypothetical protein
MPSYDGYYADILDTMAKSISQRTDLELQHRGLSIADCVEKYPEYLL